MLEGFKEYVPVVAESWQFLSTLQSERSHLSFGPCNNPVPPSSLSVCPSVTSRSQAFPMLLPYALLCPSPSCLAPDRDFKAFRMELEEQVGKREKHLNHELLTARD